MEHNWQIDAIWVSIALISGLLAMRFKQPPLIGFLLAGFLSDILVKQMDFCQRL